MTRSSMTAMRLAGKFLHALSAARQTYTLYDVGHPSVDASIREIIGRARALLEEEDVPILFVARHSFYLDRQLLSRESLSLFGLTELFERAGVESVELFPELRDSDVHTFVEILLGRRSVDSTMRGIVLNRAQPAELADEGLPFELRQGYAAGLETLRAAAIRLSAGRPVELSEIRRLIERLAELVERDPSQALLLSAVKSYDEYTYYHMMNVCLLTLALAQVIGVTGEQSVALGTGALLHDIGKLNVPKDVLQHDGALSEEEWRLIQRHPVDGAGFVLSTSHGIAHPAAAIVLHHHAAYDRSGYPTLRSETMPALPARLVAVADCFDAVTSKRSYRKPTGRREALEILQAASGSGFDPLLVRAFMRTLGLFPVGSLVRLAGGEVGMVVRNHERLLAHPVVRLVLDATGSPSEVVEIDTSDRDRTGEFRWTIIGSVHPREIGVDVSELALSGRIEEEQPDGKDPGGLVHEPSHGETPPAGYVDVHAERSEAS